MVSSPADLTINVVELLRDPGARKSVAGEFDAAALGADHPAITGPLVVSIELESSLDEVAANGDVVVPWQRPCRRCLRELSADQRVPLSERFSDDPDLIATEVVAPIERGEVDLATLVRDEVLLTVADEPLCSPDCAGLCPTCGAVLADGPCGCPPSSGDERWSVLDELRQPE